MFRDVLHFCFKISFKSIFDIKVTPFRLRMEVIWETFCFQGKHITWHGGNMWRMCEICCKYGSWLGVPGESSHAHLEVIPSRRGPLATSKQIAGRPENWKTEIRTPQYARRQDRQLQNGTEWQENKTGTLSTTAVCPEGPADLKLSIFCICLSTCPRSGAVLKEL